MIATTLTINFTNKIFAWCGIGEEMSKVLAQICFPAEDIWLHFDSNVAEADVTMLIRIKDMNCIGVYFNNLTNRLHHPKSGF